MVGQLPSKPFRAKQTKAVMSSSSNVHLYYFRLWSCLRNSRVPFITSVPNISFALTFEPPSFYSRGASTNSLDLGNRTESLAVAVITATWFASTDDMLVNSTMQSLLDNVNSAATGLGGSDSFMYLNYAGKYQDPIMSYGSQSVGYKTINRCITM